MLDESITREAIECLVVLLEVSLGGLVAVTDGHRNVLVEVSTGAGLEDVSAGLVNRSDEESHTEGSLGGVSSLDLALLANLGDHALAGVLTAVGVPVVEALVAHEFGEEAGICSHSRNNNAHVVVDLKDLLLVSG